MYGIRSQLFFDKLPATKNPKKQVPTKRGNMGAFFTDQVPKESIRAIPTMMNDLTLLGLR
jgi:hypothetical protein